MLALTRWHAQPTLANPTVFRSAPVYDSCGRAGGGPKPTGGHGEYVNTDFSHFGQMGSTLAKQPSGAVWKAGEVVEALWSVRANHGGGWQFRLCPLGSELTEACFQRTPMPFARDSRLMLSNGARASPTSLRPPGLDRVSSAARGRAATRAATSGAHSVFGGCVPCSVRALARLDTVC